MLEKIFIAAVSAIFGAGAAWATLKRIGKDVNGIGRKLSRTQLSQIIEIDDKAQRYKLADFLLR